MSFQFLNPAPVIFNLAGTEPLSGGEIQFYEKGTTTPKNTWADEALTVLNENPVPLDSAGRTETPIWLDGEYSVVIKASDGTTIATRDYTSGAGASATIPDLDPGFLTNDGLNLLWQVLREVPDPTGFTNRILSTDGANLLWIEQAEAPVIPDPDIVVTASPLSFLAGVSDDTTKLFIQAGSASANATAGRDTSASVTFPVPFAAAPFVFILPTSVSNVGGPMVPERTASTTTGFSTNFTIAAGTGGDAKIFNAVPFDWIAFGTRTVTP